MVAQEIEKILRHMLDREEIREAVTAYCRGVDRLDRELVMRVFHEDAFIDQGVFVGDRAEFWEFASGMHSSHHHVTQHYVTNHSCQLDRDIAHTETYFFYAALNKRGAPLSLMGGRYIDRFERRDGRWAIAERLTLGQWAAPSINSEEASNTPEGGPNRLNLEAWQLAVAAGQVKPARDVTDPSYARPLSVRRQRLSV